MKTAKKSFSKEPYVCQKEWPEDCFVQCGDNGIVFNAGSLDDALGSKQESMDVVIAALGGPTKKKHYRTAFFEAFPRNPSCFIRGEGETVEEAENSAYVKFQKIINCKNHVFDRRGREDGYAYCTLCPYSGSVLEPLTSCVICNVPAHVGQDLKKQWYCQEHYYEQSVEDIVGPDTGEDKGMFSHEELRESFQDNQVTFQAMKKVGVSPNLTEKIRRACERWSVAYEMDLIKQGLTGEAKRNKLFNFDLRVQIVEEVLKRLQDQRDPQN